MLESLRFFAVSSALFVLCILSLNTRSAADTREFRQVDPGIADLFVWTDTSNVYVLRSGESALLFNYGDGSVKSHLFEIGVKRIEAILLTDHHRENCQGLVTADLSNVTILASSVEQEVLEQPRSFRKWFPKLNDKYSVYGASYVRPPATPLSVTKPMEAGDSFRWNDYEIQCRSTPGTSPGGMTFVIQFGNRKVAATGSVIYDGAKMCNWYDTEWDYGFAQGLDTLLDSVNQLAEEDLDLALPAKGPVIRSARVQLKDYSKKLKSFRELYIRG